MKTHVRATGLFGAVVASALVLAGCSTTPAAEEPPAADTVTVTSFVHTLATPGDYSSVDQSTVEVEVPVNPQTVVVLDGTMLEALNALGVPASQIAGTSKFGVEQNAPAYKDVEDIQSADGRGYDLEKIEALDPDLIITGFRGSAAMIEGLDDIDAPKVELTPFMGHTVETLVSSTEALGEIFDKEDEADKLIDAFEKASADAKAATDGTTGVIIMTSGGAMSGTPEGDARYGILYNQFGIEVPDSLATVIEDLAKKMADGGEHGWELSAEAILAGNPDWIYVIDRDASFQQTGEAADGFVPAKELLNNELIKQTTAGSKDQIVYLNPVELYAGEGIISYTHAGEQIAEQVGATK